MGTGYRVVQGYGKRGTQCLGRFRCSTCIWWLVPPWCACLEEAIGSAQAAMEYRGHVCIIPVFCELEW